MKYLLILSTLLFISTAHAATGQPEGTRVSLTAVVSEEVGNDELIVHYRVAEKGSNPKKLQQKVNATVAGIEVRLKQEKVKHKTTSRRLSPVSSDGVFSTREWEMTQSGEIRTGHPDAVSNWLADIEASGAKLNHLQFRISDSSRKKVEAKLRLSAIKAFRSKAATIARGLSAKSFKIIRLNTVTRAPVTAYRQQARAVKASGYSSAPQLSAGESKIVVTVSGSIEVPFKSFPVQ
jgi:predicted secreted protein